jgi:hypothetical protein
MTSPGLVIAVFVTSPAMATITKYNGRMRKSLFLKKRVLLACGSNKKGMVRKKTADHEKSVTPVKPAKKKLTKKPEFVSGKAGTGLIITVIA